MLHRLSATQVILCKNAAKVEEQWAETGEAFPHLIDEMLSAGFVRKTGTRKVPYLFTDAGVIAVELWRAVNSKREQ